MLALLVRALVEALVRQIPTIAGWIGRWNARRTASQDQATKDERNEKAIADALKAQAEKPPLP